jgi:hypothetical protein
MASDSGGDSGKVAKGGKGSKAASSATSGAKGGAGVDRSPTNHPVTGTPLPKITRAGKVQRGGRKGR